MSCENKSNKLVPRKKSNTESFKQTINEISATIDRMRAFIKNDSGSFGQAVKALTKCRGYNKATFCAKTLLSERTYNRIICSDSRSMPKAETVMQICIGLNLGIEYGEPLFEKAGYRLDGSDILLAYRAILLLCKDIDIYECNNILEQLGFPTLAKCSMRKQLL